MKILHVVEAWKGGISGYVQALIKDQIAKGYSVYLLADNKQLNQEIEELNQVKIIEYSASRNPLKLFKVASDIREKANVISPDVIHCHSTFPGFYVRLLKQLCRVIYTPHGWSFFKKDVSRITRFIYKLIEFLLSFRCNKIICMSLEEINAARSLGISSERLTLIYTGIPDLEVKNNKKAIFDNGEPIRVGFFGRFDYQKGFDLIENITPFLKDDLEFHLFGGAVRNSESEIDKRFICHGWIEHSKMHECISTVDVVVIPSRWEGFALIPLEAMRAGKAVIVSNLSSLPEVVIHGFNGIVLSDYSTKGLASVLNGLNKDECIRMGDNGLYVYQQTFTFESFSKKIEKAYFE